MSVVPVSLAHLDAQGDVRDSPGAARNQSFIQLPFYARTGEQPLSPRRSAQECEEELIALLLASATFVALPA